MGHKASEPTSNNFVSDPHTNTYSLTDTSELQKNQGGEVKYVFTLQDEVNEESKNCVLKDSAEEQEEDKRQA